MMQRAALIEPFSGASGNMLLAGFFHLDSSLIPRFERAMSALPFRGWTLQKRAVLKCHLAATWADFEVPPEHEHRHLSDILQMLENSDLAESVKRRSQEVFRRLGAAEAKVHGVGIEEVHFHEVGAVDSILDIVGFCWCCHELKLERLFCTPFPMSSGSIHCQHGQFPNPGPATLELLLGFPTRPMAFDREMLTPTAAALLTTLAEFELPTVFVPEQIGYGAGTADFPFPNVCRIQVGRSQGPHSRSGHGHETHSHSHGAHSHGHEAHSHSHGAHSHGHDAHSHSHGAHSHGHEAHSHSHGAHSHGHEAHSHSHGAHGHGHEAHSHSHGAHSHGHDSHSHSETANAGHRH